MLRNIILLAALLVVFVSGYRCYRYEGSRVLWEEMTEQEKSKIETCTTDGECWRAVDNTSTYLKCAYSCKEISLGHEKHSLIFLGAENGLMFKEPVVVSCCLGDLCNNELYPPPATFPRHHNTTSSASSVPDSITIMALMALFCLSGTIRGYTFSFYLIF